MFTETLSRTTAVHPGILLGRALWADRLSRHVINLNNRNGRNFSGELYMMADSVSPRMNTIALRDQVKPMRIGVNLVVSYIVYSLPQCPSEKTFYMDA